ncbi:MAG: hypothetical protein HGA80_06065 [Candidatus Omnitrophica bacterium]|nr:hypothetical protein [Candidatus Omnitrophota bacterium]
MLQTTILPSPALAQVAAGFSSVQVSGAMAVIPTQTPVLVRQDGSANKDFAPLLLGKSVMEAELRARGGSTGTAYTYDPNTAELLNINYADTTPDVTFTYDRLGRQVRLIRAWMACHSGILSMMATKNTGKK